MWDWQQAARAYALLEPLLSTPLQLLPKWCHRIGEARAERTPPPSRVAGAVWDAQAVEKNIGWVVRGARAAWVSKLLARYL